MGWNRVLRGLLAGLLPMLAASITFAAAPVAADGSPYRFLYDEEFFWVDAQGAKDYVARARDAGFNALVPCIWHGRGVTWKSGLPLEPRMQKNPRHLADPLANLIREAHAAGLEVHPWFTVMLRQRDFMPSGWSAGAPDKAFDVHNPEFQRFMVDLIADVVRRYDVDGINLDYIRSKGICSSSVCEAAYVRATGRNLKTDRLLTGVSGAAHDAVAAWNERSVTALVASISREVRAVKPGVKLSISTHAALPELRIEGANGIEWTNRGLIDFILHIEYAQVADMRRDLLKEAMNRLDDPSRLIMIAGNYERNPRDKSDVWPREPEAVGAAVRYALDFNPHQQGMALYTYSYLTDGQSAVIRKILRGDGLSKDQQL